MIASELGVVSRDSLGLVRSYTVTHWHIAEMPEISIWQLQSSKALNYIWFGPIGRRILDSFSNTVDEYSRNHHSLHLLYTTKTLESYTPVLWNPVILTLIY
jgi:hypothetical protein